MIAVRVQSRHPHHHHHSSSSSSSPPFETLAASGAFESKPRATNVGGALSSHISHHHHHHHHRYHHGHDASSSTHASSTTSCCCPSARARVRDWLRQGMLEGDEASRRDDSHNPRARGSDGQGLDADKSFSSSSSLYDSSTCSCSFLHTTHVAQELIWSMRLHLSRHPSLLAPFLSITAPTWLLSSASSPRYHHLMQTLYRWNLPSLGHIMALILNLSSTHSRSLSSSSTTAQYSVAPSSSRVCCESCRGSMRCLD